MDLDFGGQNPMLVITVDASSQAPYRSFPCKHENSFIPLLLLFPKSLATFREPCFQSLMPFSPNIVPAQESHRSVAALVPPEGVVARPYPVRTVIQLSFEAVPHSLFRANRKSRFTQHLVERIEIPFRSKKLCKSALLQSRSLFVRRPVNRLKTLGRRRHLIAAEALAAAQARRSPWHEPRKICASRIFSCVLPQWRAWVLYQGCENCQGKTGEV